MSFLYRFAVTITRKQPFIDWANSFDDDVELTAEIADAGRTIYLVPETTDEPDRAEILDEFWDSIFEQELGAWVLSDEKWPAPRTREMFDEWFDAEITSAVFDLTPDEPLTQQQVELIDLEEAVSRCAWCEIDLVEGAGRVVGFKVADADRFAEREGLTVPIPIDEDRIVVALVPPRDSEPARAGEDLVFRACSTRCERALRSVVPKALRRLSRR